jgi:hypothetical protein
MNKMRNIKLTFLAAIVAGALAVPAVGSAAGASTAPVTAAGIKLKACQEKDVAPLLMFVRGISCGKALDLANAATTYDDPCPAEWNTRHVRLQARVDGKVVSGPFVFLCSQKSGRRAFTYHPVTG